MKTKLLLSLLMLLSIVSCHHIDDDRIPPMPVRIGFATVGDWNVSGIGGALDYKRFIKSKNIPSTYHYTDLSATGFGGVLLVGDVNGKAAAYDLACPVECKRDVLIQINTQTMEAECPKCHSTYDVFSLGGHPLSGEAAREGYGLRRYNVGPTATDYMLISY